MAYRKRMMSGVSSLAKKIQSKTRSVRKYAAENKKQRNIFVLALVALVGASALGYVKFQKPEPKG